MCPALSPASCYSDAEVLLPRLVFLAFPPPPPFLLFALNLPCRPAAAADALLGMVNSDLLLLLLNGFVAYASRAVVTFEVMR
jgi:hypothetical protein